MKKIHILSPHEARKIAAGEVVERPANIVKELLENALDAQATAISIYCEDGGKKSIRVVDNGCGMSVEDAKLCFGLHATSKITSINDLQTLNTFGFRGEALASISGIAKIYLITKEKNAETGIKISMEHGFDMQEEIVACAHGTDITVDDIFYTVPARKKFLKKTETEWNHILQLFQAFCLSQLSVHFKLFLNNSLVYNCSPTTTLQERTSQLWDHNFTSNTLIVEPTEKHHHATIQGIITNHHYARYDRNNMFFFVNNRWIKNSTISRSVLKGYLNVLPTAKYPAVALFITIDPQYIDVNIHPRKEEVQFLHPRALESTLQNTVKKTLEQHLSSRITETSSFLPDASLFFSKIHASDNHAPPMFSGYTLPAEKHSTQLPSFTINQQAEHENNTPRRVFTQHDKEDAQTSNSSIHYLNSENLIADYHVIGQFKKTYILLEKNEGLFLIDQHAAHERILYEQFSAQAQTAATIDLLFPPIISLPSTSMLELEKNFDVFKNNGITLEIFGENKIIVKSVPVHSKNIAFDDLIYKTLEWIKEYSYADEHNFAKNITHKLCAQMACKAAVKAGDALTMSQITQLLEDLQKTANRFSCPHGRPTGWLLPLYDIEKKFKRVN